MKKLLVLFAGLFLVVVATENVNAQTSATTSAETFANIITPITIQKTVDLVFGDIVPTDLPGTVVIPVTGLRSFTGGAFAFANSTGSPSAAQFTVSGENNAAYSIVVDNTSFTISNGSATMIVNNIVTSPTPNGKLNGSGLQTITVGATLNVLGSQAPGLYKNEDALSITVAYN
jgi:hypothetical protein